MTRLRRLSPDPALFRRRAAGEPLRAIAADYGVSHTSLSRYFARAEARRELKRAVQLSRAEERAADARFRAELRALEERFWAKQHTDAARAARAASAAERASSSRRAGSRDRLADGEGPSAPALAAREQRTKRSGRAAAAGLVRLTNPEGTVTKAVEAAKVPALLETGWTLA